MLILLFLIGFAMYWRGKKGLEKTEEAEEDKEINDNPQRLN